MGPTKVQDALLTVAQQVMHNTELLLDKTRDWQIIKQHLCSRLSDIQLTPKQQEKLNRYNFIYNQMVTGKYRDADICSLVMKIYNSSQRQAYEDISCTKELFNSALNISKLFEIKLQLEVNRSMLNKAAEQGDLKAYAQLEKNRTLLLKELPDENENPAEDFEGHEIEAVFDPRLLGAGTVDMKKVLEAVNAKRDKKINVDMFEELEIEKDPE